MNPFPHIALFAMALVATSSPSVSQAQKKAAISETSVHANRTKGHELIKVPLYSTINLVQNPRVRQDIRLTEEQTRKIHLVLEEVSATARESATAAKDIRDGNWQPIRDRILNRILSKAVEANKEIETLLTPEQLRRLGEIAIQQQGLHALSNPKIAKKLNLSEEQSRKIAAIRAEAKKRHIQVGEELRAGKLFRAEALAKGKLIEEETDKKILEVLTMEQQTRFQQMQGEKFAVERPFSMRWDPPN